MERLTPKRSRAVDRSRRLVRDRLPTKLAPRCSRIPVLSDLTLGDAKKLDDAELIECVVLVAVMTYGKR